MRFFPILALLALAPLAIAHDAPSDEFVAVETLEGETLYLSLCTLNPTAEPTRQLLETRVGDCFGTTGLYAESNDVEDLQTRGGVWTNGSQTEAYSADASLLP